MRHVRGIWLGATAVALLASSAAGQTPARPWLDPARSPDERARLAVAAMTLDEQIAMLHGGMPKAMPKPWPADLIPGAGYVPGVPRLGIPALRETDAGLGVTNQDGMREGDVATAFPGALAIAATWDPATAYEGGAVIGREARAKGFNVLLAGAVNLVREPRNGRNFEYPGEDPLLAGVIAGEAIRGTQDQKIISTIKHFALNAQETGRKVLDARIGWGALRESDLLAFQIAIERSDPGSVMCAYNKVNGEYACENDYLLNRTLKQDWGWKGWVMSDWGAVHSTARAALNGLDQQSGEQLDFDVFFGAALKQAVATGQVPKTRLRDMNVRILRTMFAKGVVDAPAEPGGTIDYDAHGKVTQAAAEKSFVLLKNERGALPLARGLKRIAVIGPHADKGVLVGGGSSEVIAPDGPAHREPPPYGGLSTGWTRKLYHKSSPLEAIRGEAPRAEVLFDDGSDPRRAAALARRADAVLVFVEQWATEAADVGADLALPGAQDALVAAVAATGTPTTVVLQTGGPVHMPWLEEVEGVLQAWYPGSRGGQAIARVLFGSVEPAGRLPITWPTSEKQLPRPVLDGYAHQVGAPLVEENHLPDFPVGYREGADVGYRWFEKQNHKPLFPFGHGLTYTSFTYDDLRLTGGERPTVRFTVRNSGGRKGTEVAQVYARPPMPGAARRLIGWQRVELRPGEARTLEITADPRLLGRFDMATNSWNVPAGELRVEVGRHAGDAALSGVTKVQAATLKP
ncbi:MAG TPA: beta-glucosidase [Sphingomonadaceae bacterium]|nr:beta-glucosidase [Sphingomonadaceae bacterium]